MFDRLVIKCVKRRDEERDEEKIEEEKHRPKGILSHRFSCSKSAEWRTEVRSAREKRTIQTRLELFCMSKGEGREKRTTKALSIVSF